MEKYTGSIDGLEVMLRHEKLSFLKGKTGEIIFVDNKRKTWKLTYAEIAGIIQNVKNATETVKEIPTQQNIKE
jgi:hypothetical protein